MGGHQVINLVSTKFLEDLGNFGADPVGPASMSMVFSGSAMRMASPWPTSMNLMVTFVLACAVSDGALEPDWEDPPGV